MSKKKGSSLPIIVNNNECSLLTSNPSCMPDLLSEIDFYLSLQAGCTISSRDGHDWWVRSSAIKNNNIECFNMSPFVTTLKTSNPASPTTTKSPFLKNFIDQMDEMKKQAGTVEEFIEIFNNTPSKMGLTVGVDAGRALIRLGNTEVDWKQLRPLPTTTPYFNNRNARYIYTKKGGWIDMVHFLFYAGKAYNYKVQKEAAIEEQRIKKMKEKEMAKAYKNGGGYWPPIYPGADPIQIVSNDPVAEAVQDGYWQEMTDRVAAKHSAYSFEDLPSDKFGAEFGANYFNINSTLTLGEQIANYLNSLEATEPQNAPNYENLSHINKKTGKPSRTNHTTKPVYTEENP